MKKIVVVPLRSDRCGARCRMRVVSNAARRLHPRGARKSHYRVLAHSYALSCDDRSREVALTLGSQGIHAVISCLVASGYVIGAYDLAFVAQHFGGRVAAIVHETTSLSESSSGICFERMSAEARVIVMAQMVWDAHDVRDLDPLRGHFERLGGPDELRDAFWNKQLRLTDRIAYLHIERFLRLRAQRHARIYTHIHAAIEPSFVLRGRRKEIHSIHSKMQRSRLRVDQLYDVIAFRLLCRDTAECYTALRLVKRHFVVVHVTNYIIHPKWNGYRSLHAICAAEDNVRFEVQIRSFAMELACTHGTCAHRLYKEETRQ